MKPKSISYSESKESFDITTGLKSWRKAGVEIELDGDDVDKAYSEAKQIVGKALMPFMIGMNAIPEMNMSPTIMANIGLQTYGNATPLPTIDYSAKEEVEKAIDNCTFIQELELLMGDAAKHHLIKQYLEKKKSLK
jgi:hypothetical protein